MEEGGGEQEGVKVKEVEEQEGEGYLQDPVPY